MATKKITQLTELTSAADDDLLAIVDTSGTATKKIRKDNLFAGLVPTGTIDMYAGTTDPSGWMICNGRAISRATYAALFAAIGTSYGIGDGATTFNIPDMRGKFPVGLNASDTSFDALNDQGGEKSHTITTDEMPSHQHSITTANVWNPTSAFTINDNSGDYIASSDNVLNSPTGNAYVKTNRFSTELSGGGQAHNNLPPYIVVNFKIKL